MKKALIFPLLLSAFLLSGCSNDSWTGFYYPDITKMNDESTWRIQPSLKSLEACRNWADDMAGDNNKVWDYECGTGCRYEKDIKMNVCKETLQ